jgi:hypothetical protein
MPLAHRPVLFRAKYLKSKVSRAYVSGFVGFLFLSKQTNPESNEMLRVKNCAEWLWVVERLLVFSRGKGVLHAESAYLMSIPGFTR